MPSGPEVSGKMGRREFVKRAVVLTTAVALGACDTPQRRKNAEPSPTPETMGGIWVSPSPDNGATIHSPILTLAAQAYPVNNGSPIKDVQFTAHWDGAPSPDPEHNPGGWPILATVTNHDTDFVYHTIVDLRKVLVDGDAISVPYGEVTISFDVYNEAGKAKDAPNGEHKITYLPE